MARIPPDSQRTATGSPRPVPAPQLVSANVTNMLQSGHTLRGRRLWRHLFVSAPTHTHEGAGRTRSTNRLSIRTQLSVAVVRPCDIKSYVKFDATQPGVPV
ncbi:protein of unknown function [Burkholderia multivorans]